MRAVNLLPRDEAPKSFEKNRGVAFAAAGGTAVITAAFCMLLLGAGGAIKDRRVTLDSLNAELAGLPRPSTTDPSKEAALAAEKTARTTALSSALAKRVAWDGILRQISQVLPGDVWLTQLQTAGGAAATPAPAAAATTAPTSLELAGSTYSQSGVARFLARLALVPSLSNVTLASSTLAPAGSKEIVQFSIRADIVAKGGSA
jgi:Tfp pilus assembly protein PilN